MFRKYLILFIIFVFITGVLSGCNNSDVLLAEQQILRYNLGTEPETLDSAKAKGNIEFNVLINLFEGLIRLDATGNPQPAAAESWDIEDNGKKYIFHLRDTKWSNGDPVTAYDFEYSWKRVLNPDTASGYAYQLFYIKNAAAYNSRDSNTSSDTVGVKALDEKTLEVTLEAPTAYFLTLLASPVYYPVHKPTVEEQGDKYGAQAEGFVSNGPFKIVSWRHQEKIELAKNENYWDSEQVKLSRLVFLMIDNPSTELAAFETGQIEFGDNPPYPEIERLKQQNKAKIASDFSNYFFMFNVKKPPLNDPRVRKALNLAIDRKALVENVLKAGQVPALAFVPYGLKDLKGEDFRATGADYFKDADFEKARELLSEAGYPDGKGFPEIQILTNNNGNNKPIAEAVQQMWSKNLNIKVKIKVQEWMVYLESLFTGDYQTSGIMWSPDYLDPMTFLDIFVTGGGNNVTFWGNKDYDNLIETAKKTSDLEKRFELMHDAEEILMEEMPVSPIFFNADPYMLKPYVKDVILNPMGWRDFKNCWIEKH
ncbi:MAG: oligopeptide transport system substrate-binding protein [Thermosediminibacterales bacterium]|nr:oligopeptide transport system substrate-binding protein [Thermosediminibacterales bacterium]MDK2836425.1 oligopeptide transport system substrate-binding protein [Thermosediminibacterales bacterium]